MKDEKCIIIIDGYYFDVTTYLDKHSGGANILRKYHMKDATTHIFNSIKGHGDSYAIDLME